jgi:hypothetical protein
LIDARQMGGRLKIWSTTTLAVLAVTMAGVGAASAQQRPLATEDPETVGPGNILVEGGFDLQQDIFYPASGLRGNLLRAPTLGVSFGFSSILELQVDGGFYQRLNVTSRVPAPLARELDFSGDSTSDIEDLVVATKIRVVSEAPGRPSFGIRLATKLPLASNEKGLGLDTMDFYMSGLIGKTTNSVRFVGNFGLGVLSDPLIGSEQNDVLTYGLSVARALQQGFELVGEINGRLNTRDDDIPTGTETRSGMRVGLRFTSAAVRVDGAMLFGLTSRDPNFGVTGGITYVFRGFTLP